jgi:hypothetical protein
VPQRDTIHDVVKQALIQEGWDITDDPYVISFGERFLFVDLGASATQPFEQPGGRILGAQREDRRIAVEIKEFRGRSAIADLEQALGQYVLYKLLLHKVDPVRELYLAVTDVMYDEFFSEPIGELVVNELPLQLLIVASEKAEVLQWIPPPRIETS